MTDASQDPEAARLSALRELELLDSPPDPELDRLTAAIATSLGVPICLISLVDTERLWFKSRVGTELTDLPRSHSFCARVVTERQPMTWPDLGQEPLFADGALVQHGRGPIQFYAGAPLWFKDQVVGTLCVLDQRARTDFLADRQALLADFARIVCDTIASRQVKLTAQRERALFADGPVAAVVWDNHPRQPRLTHHSENLAKVIGNRSAEALRTGAPLDSLLDARDAAEARMALLSHSHSHLQHSETVFRMAGGTRWVQLVTYGDYDERGQLQRIRGYLSDTSRQKQLEATIETTRERLHLAMESARMGTWDLDLLSQERISSARVAAMLGHRAEELAMAQSQWVGLMHPFDRAEVAQKMAERLALSEEELSARKDVFSVEYRLRHKRGHHIWVQSCSRLVSRDARGRPARLVGTLLDITEAKAAELLRSQQQQLLGLVNTTQRTFLRDKSLTAACDAIFEPLLRMTDSQFGFIGIVEHDAAGQVVLRVPSISNISWDEESRAWYQQHQASGDGMAFTNLDNLFGHVVTHDTVVCTNDVAAHPHSRGTPQGHPPLRSFLGVPLHHDNRVVGMIALGNRADGYHPEMIQALEPLTLTLGTLIQARAAEEERARTEQLLLVQATVDSLTGLSNRRRFFEATDNLLTQCRRYGTPATIALMDLDHFKHVNDQHGHAVGDAVLRAFSDLLREVLRESDLPARIGGEEFAVLMPSTTEAEAVVPLERIRHDLAQMDIEIGGRSVRVSVSIGLCEWREDLGTPDAWLAQADQALYRAKDAGRNRLCASDAHAN